MSINQPPAEAPGMATRRMRVACGHFGESTANLGKEEKDMEDVTAWEHGCQAGCRIKW